MAAATPSPISPAMRQLRLIAIVFVVLTAGLVALYFFVLRKEWAVLYKDLRPAEASAIVDELKQQQVEYRLEAGGADILVPLADVDAVRLSVASAELPVKGLEGFELFNSSDMGLTDFTQKIKYQRAIQGELARTIMMMDGVIEARVHISMPERALFRTEQGKPKAAVTLVTRSRADETPQRIDGVQELVAAAISDLNVADVVVLNGHGEVISAKPPPPVAPNPYASIRQEISAVVAKLLPGQRFDIAISDASTAAALAGAPARPSRSIALRTAAAVSEADQQKVVTELRSAKLADAADLIRFEILAPDSPATALAATPSVTPQQAAPASSRSPPASIAQVAQIGPAGAVFIGLGLAAAAVLAIAAIMMMKRSRPLLSLEDQRRFAERLRLGLQLEQEEVNHERA